MNKKNLYTDITLITTDDYADGITYSCKNNDEKIRFDIYDLRNRSRAKDMYGSVISGCEEYIKDIKSFDEFINSHKNWSIYLHRRRTNKKQIIGAYIDDNIIGYIAPQLYDFIAPFFRGKGVAVARIIKGIYNSKNGKYYLVIGCRQEDILVLEDYQAHNDLDFYSLYAPLPILDDIFELTHELYYYKAIGETPPENSFDKIYNENTKDINAHKSGQRISTRTPFIKNIINDFDLTLYKKMIEECPNDLPDKDCDIVICEHNEIKDRNEKEIKRLKKILIEKLY